MKTFELIGKVIMFVLMGLCVIFYVLCSGDSNPLAEGSWVGTTISWAIGTLAFGAILAVISEIIGAISDTKGLIKSVITVVGFVLLLVIFWNLADGTPLNLIGYEGDENTYVWLKVADTGIFCCYFALAGAIISIVASEIIQLFR